MKFLYSVTFLYITTFYFLREERAIVVNVTTNRWTNCQPHVQIQMQLICNEKDYTKIGFTQEFVERYLPNNSKLYTFENICGMSNSRGGLKIVNAEYNYLDENCNSIFHLLPLRGAYANNITGFFLDFSLDQFTIWGTEPKFCSCCSAQNNARCGFHRP